jgi:hypothetical protein
MSDVALLLVVTDALVARLRARVGGWDFEDKADQRDTLARLVEAEEEVAALRGVYEWHDLPEPRGRLAEGTRWVAEEEEGTPRTPRQVSCPVRPQERRLKGFQGGPLGFG